MIAESFSLRLARAHSQTARRRALFRSSAARQSLARRFSVAELGFMLRADRLIE
jgi:hypothetical protein